MIAAYDAIAEWYDQSIRKGTLLSADDLIASICFESVGNVEGQYLCDLACGQGHLSRQLAARGAEVVGVDISQRLLEIARREGDGIRYVHGDAQALPPLGDRPFDGVLCNLALMDIPDIDATFREAARILCPGGSFVATIIHPCFQIPQNRGYFDEGFWRSDYAQGVRGQVGARHRTLGTYLTGLGQAGLLLESAAEPRLPGRDVPPVLVLQARRVLGT